MDKKRFTRYWLLLTAGVLIACAYPLYMGAHVVALTARMGYVPLEEYPKYVIPYTPIALSLIAGALTLPLFMKLRKAGFPLALLFVLCVFYAAERLMETKILVRGQTLVILESWQMSLCYVPPEYYETRTWEAVDVLLGGYSPAFKLHFYLISAIIISGMLNCFHGFGRMALTGDTSRKKALILQAGASLAFLGMCIWACFTAFYRTGELIVSPLSAVLMAVFFVLLGVTIGVFVGSLTLRRGKAMRILLPACVASLVTVAMYIGETILLSGQLYRFGEGFFFRGLGKLVLAPADVLIVIASGAVTALLLTAVGGRKKAA